MHVWKKTSGLIGLAAVGTCLAPTAPANALPDRDFPVQVTCNGNVVGYVSPMLGADPIWVDMNGDGALDRYAIVYATDYLSDGTLLMTKTYGVKAGYGPVVQCTHFADWGSGVTIHGDLWLAAAPA